MADINANRPGYKQTKVGWVPEEWEVVSLEKLSEKVMVGIASSATHAYRETGVPMFRNQNIKELGLDTEDLLFVDEEYEKQHKGKRLKAGDVLTIRTGYPGVSAVVPDEYEGAQCFTSLITRPNKKLLDSQWLTYYINSPIGKRLILGAEAGGAQKNVNAGVLKKLKVPKIPLPEQHRIAAILSTWDDAIQTLDRLIAKKQELKKGLMQQLLSGRVRFPEFVPEGGTRYKETKLGRVPVEWEVVRFADVFNFLSTTSYSRSNLTLEEEDSNGIFYIHYGDIHTIFDQPIIDIDKFSVVPRLKSDVSLPKKRDYLKSGDVIIADASEDYEGVGECIEVILNKESLALSGLHTFAVRDEQEKTILGFRTYLLINPPVRKSLKRIATGSKVFGISKSNISRVLLMIPSKLEQQKIADVLKNINDEIKILKERKEQMAGQKKGLMQQLLTGAIRVNTQKNS